MNGLGWLVFDPENIIFWSSFNCTRAIGCSDDFCETSAHLLSPIGKPSVEPSQSPSTLIPTSAPHINITKSCQCLQFSCGNQW